VKDAPDLLKARAITLHQPWAAAIASGLKSIETRSWTTNYRGCLLIHAGAKGYDSHSHRMLADEVREHVESRCYAHFLRPLSLGAIVAYAELVACEATLIGAAREPWLKTVPRAERILGDFGQGRWLWQLENVIPLREPVPCRGSLGLWKPPDDVLRAVRKGLTIDLTAILR